MTQIVDALKAAPGGNPYTEQNTIQPIKGLDPQTALRIIGRELNRNMAGMGG